MAKLPSSIQKLADKGKNLADRFMATLPGRFIKKFGDDQITHLASIIAYNALFSMFPILLSILTITSFVLADPAINQRLVDSLITLLPGSAGEEIAGFLNITRENRGLLGLFNLIILLWAGSGLIGSFELGFDVIYHVKQRDMIRRTLISFGMIFVFAFFALLSISASSIATFLAQIPAGEIAGFEIGTLTQLLIGWIISFASAFTLFTILYWVLPNKRLPILHVLPGAAASGILFVLIVQIFPFYAANFGRFNRYGAVIGLFLLLMTWFYFLGIIILLGAEINSVLFKEDVGYETRRLFPPSEEEHKGYAARANIPEPVTAYEDIKVDENAVTGSQDEAPAGPAVIPKPAFFAGASLILTLLAGSIVYGIRSLFGKGSG